MDELIEPKQASATTVNDTEYQVPPYFVILWSFVAFLFTLFVCLFIKNINHKLITKHIEELFRVGLQIKRTKSKIPIPVSKSTATEDSGEPKEIQTDFGDDVEEVDLKGVEIASSFVSCPITNTQGTNTETKNASNPEKDKIFKTARHMEKHCSKLREELLNQKLSSQKEHCHLQKKIESLTKEKRELNRQLVISQKENRAAKQQLEEIATEKAGILDRLDSATKEIRVNTKTKKNTLDKLEEALHTIDKLNKKLEQVSRDKEIIENKFKILDAEYKQMQEKTDCYFMRNFDIQEPERDKENSIMSKESGDYVLHTSKDSPQKLEEDVDISESEKDMKKVQIKLLNLEKSLEKLKQRETNATVKDNLDIIWNDLQKKLEESEPDSQSMPIDETPSIESICVDSDCLLEHHECTKVECLKRKRHFKGKECPVRQDEVDTSSEETSFLNELNPDIYFDHFEMNDCVNKFLELHKDFPKQFEDDSGLCDKNVDDMQRWENKKGVISKSPAFRNFLLTILETNI